MLLGDARCPRLGAVDGPVHGDGTGRGNCSGDGRRGSRTGPGDRPPRGPGNASRSVGERRGDPRSHDGVRGMTFVRTVLGDLAPSALGVTYAHEHLIIDGGRPVELSPDFLLDDVDRLVLEVREAAAAGLDAAVDAMPADCGRNPTKLAALSRETGVSLIAATGLHHERFTGPSHWSLRASEDELADLFAADVGEGIDERDYTGPIVRRTEVRAGVIKIAGSVGGPSDRDRPIFRAAAATHHRTGVPIHTHCEGGTGALDQVRLLVDAGVGSEHLSLSHVDKVVDRGYHRDLFDTGAFAVYDQAFRWGDRENGTLQL